MCDNYTEIREYKQPSDSFINLSLLVKHITVIKILPMSFNTVICVSEIVWEFTTTQWGKYGQI